MKWSLNLAYESFDEQYECLECPSFDNKLPFKTPIFVFIKHIYVNWIDICAYIDASMIKLQPVNWVSIPPRRRHVCKMIFFDLRAF